MFDEQKVQAWFDRMEQLKKDTTARLSQSSAAQSKKEVVTPVSREESKASNQKVASSKKLNEPSQEQLPPNPYLVQSTESNQKPA